MIEKTYTITNGAGIHSHSATTLVSSLTPFTSNVMMEYNGRHIDLKSIMGVMSLGIPTGASVKVTADGADEEQAMAKIEEVMKDEELSE